MLLNTTRRARAYSLHKLRATITMDGGVIFLREFAQRMRAGRWFVDATVFCQQNVYNLNYPAQKTYWTH